MKTIRSDKLQQYLASLEALAAEKADLEARLERINSALADAPGFGADRGHRRSGGHRRRNGMSLREAVAQVTRSRPLTKAEILQAILKLGYKFATKDPMNSLNAMLYAPINRFRNKEGRFAPK